VRGEGEGYGCRVRMRAEGYGCRVRMRAEGEGYGRGEGDAMRMMMKILQQCSA